MMAKGNTLQAMLDRAKAGGDAPATPAPSVAATPTPAKPAQAGRQGTKLIGGHFAPEVSTQLRILAAEEAVTLKQQEVNQVSATTETVFVFKYACSASGPPSDP